MIILALIRMSAYCLYLGLWLVIRRCGQLDQSLWNNITSFTIWHHMIKEMSKIFRLVSLERTQIMWPQSLFIMLAHFSSTKANRSDNRTHQRKFLDGLEEFHMSVNHMIHLTSQLIQLILIRTILIQLLSQITILTQILNQRKMILNLILTQSQ